MEFQSSLHYYFRGCKLRPYLGGSSRYRREREDDYTEAQLPQRVVRGQPLRLCLEVLPGEDWSSSMLSEFTSTFETFSSQIGFSYSLQSGDKVLIQQETPFEFLQDEEGNGSTFDDGSPKVNVNRDKNSLTFSMDIRIEIADEYLNRPLRLLFCLNYFVETFGLSSNQLQMEAERRSSTIDPDRNDHLRGYIGVDEEEFRVRQLMEFNRFRPTKVPPQKAELSVEVVQPLTVTSTCEEISPSCAILTLSIQNSYPGTTVALQRVTIHANDTIKGATLLRNDAPSHTARNGGDSDERKHHREIDNVHEGAVASIHDDLLNGGEGEGEGEGEGGGEDKGELLDVDLRDEGEETRGGEEDAAIEAQVRVDDSATGESARKPCTIDDKNGLSSGEQSHIRLSDNESVDLDPESAYLMQLSGRPLDVSSLFTFTALHTHSPLMTEDTSGSSSPHLRVVPPGATCTQRYKVEPRQNGGALPFLNSSLLVGDFFSPLSVVWRAHSSTTTTVESELETETETEAVAVAVADVRGREESSVGTHVAYWSMGKRWANLCCFEEVSVAAGLGGIPGTEAPISPVLGVSPYAGRQGAEEVSYSCLGTQIGEGSPMKSPYVGRSSIETTSPSASSIAPVISTAHRDTHGAATTATVITPSKRRRQDTVSSRSYSQEGTFVLTMRGPTHVTVGSAFEVHLEMTNKSSRVVSDLSLRAGSDNVDGTGQDVPYVIHESITSFSEILRPDHSLHHTLHVYPLTPGPFKLNTLSLVEQRSEGSGKDQREEIYEFLQFFSCVVEEKG